MTNILFIQHCNKCRGRCRFTLYRRNHVKI